MKALFGTKIGMTQLFSKDGKAYPTTIIYFEPNKVLEVKTKAKDGYDAVLLGYQQIPDRKVNKPKMGLFKKAKSAPKRHIQEIRGMVGYNVGDEITVADLFANGDFVDVQAFSKGKGYTGAIKRWNFKVGPLGHGAGYPHRYQGSIAAGRGSKHFQRVLKNTKMAGRMGNEKVTIQNLNVLAVDSTNNLLLVKGAIPGIKKATVLVKKAVKKPNKQNVIELLKNKPNFSFMEETKPEVKKVEQKVETKEVNANIEINKNQEGAK